jgi:hypothetical protein
VKRCGGVLLANKKALRRKLWGFFVDGYSQFLLVKVAMISPPEY